MEQSELSRFPHPLTLVSEQQSPPSVVAVRPFLYVANQKKASPL